MLAHATRDGHSSGTTFARRLEQPTRTASLTSSRGVFARRTSPRCRPYSVLLPVWFAMPSPLPETRCALTAPFHPCPPLPPQRERGGGLFSVALSLGSPPPDVIRHRMSMEPGLSSPAAFRPWPERPSGRLTLGMGCQRPAVKVRAQALTIARIAAPSTCRWRSSRASRSAISAFSVARVERRLCRPPVAGGNGAGRRRLLARRAIEISACRHAVAELGQ